MMEAVILYSEVSWRVLKRRVLFHEKRDSWKDNSLQKSLVDLDLFKTCFGYLRTIELFAPVG